MRVIVFDRELHEPLTIVNLPVHLFEMGKAGMPIALAPERPMMAHPYAAGVPEVEDIEIVYLRLERVSRGSSDNIIFWYAYADDPELALALRCAYLPGQLGDVRRRERASYLKGLLAAFG